jgi:[acyl-carrier-protein] S-malonyltransferase
MVIKNKSLAFVCPGQGSQFVGMGKELAQDFPVARQIFEEADKILGFPLSALMREGPEDKLNDTINTQPALMTHSVAAWQVLMENQPRLTADYIAGHSMGELSALVISGSLTFPEGLRLVRKRGELMKQAGEISPGKMAAILGLDIQAIEKIVSDSRRVDEPLQIANDNCPGQVVISGASVSIERAITAAKEAGAKRAIPLAVSIAAHSQLMNHAQEAFNQAVLNAPITKPDIPIIGNVTARPLHTVDDIRADLQSQLTQPVRWTESIEFMVDKGVNLFIELGSGNVLSGLIRRINKAVERISLGNPDDFDF